MGAKEFASLLGGLALFLYGMNMMSQGMEAAAGNKMKQILERLTTNRYLGVLVGAVITAIIQSSSATTVMVVGFVNSGMMTLRQAVGVIMGANIGTTITGQLIALDAGAIAPSFPLPVPGRNPAGTKAADLHNLAKSGDADRVLLLLPPLLICH